MSEATPRRAWVYRLLQVGASLLVLVLLFREVDVASVKGLWPRLHLRWLALALLLKAATLLLHELRLWVSLNPPRPPVGRVVAIGLASGCINLVLPGRAGDLAAIGMLVRECRLSTGAAAAAVGIVAFLEAAMFGLTFATALVVGSSRWLEVMGTEQWLQTLSGVTGLTLLGIVIAAASVIFTRRFVSVDGPPPPGPSPLAIVRDALLQASTNLSAPLTLGINAGLALLQVIGMVAAFAMLFPAVGVSVPLPILAAAGILGMSSLAAVVLPPSFGAGPAAAAVFVLGAFGLGQADALAYSVGWWMVSQVPATLLGLPAFYGRGERLSLGSSLSEDTGR